MSPPKRRKRRPLAETTPSTTCRLCHQFKPEFDQLDFDERVIAQVDWSLWRALRRGEFRLAVKCGRCRRWLHNPASKRAHRDRCKAVTK